MIDFTSFFSVFSNQLSHREVGMQHFRRIIGYWCPLAIVASGLCFFTYVAVQQNYRMNANDPQVELAQNDAVALKAGISPAQIVSSEQVDIGSSLSTFTLIFDANGNVLASSTLLDGKTPDIPAGVLTAAVKTGENRVRWQPRSGLRFATVIDAYKSPSGAGFVLVGRSLREAEARIDNLTLMLTLTWLAALVASFVAVILAEYLLLHPRENN
jgi:hypothetical protein